MSAADPLTDTTGVQVGDPDPWTGDYDMCEARLESAGHLICTAPRGHTGPHVAAGASDIIAVDPGRPTVTDQALAEAWAEGHRTGWEHCQDGNYGNDHWDDPTPNPYAAADRPSVTDNARDEEPLAWCPGCGDRIPTEVIRERGVCSNCYGTSDDPWVTARAEAWDEGYQDGLRQGGEGEDGPRYVNPYRAAGRAETTTSTTEDTARAIHRALAPRWMSVAQALGPDQDAYEAMLADIAQALADDGLLATARTATIEDAARVLVRETTSGLCEYGRVCDECDCFADAGGRERDAHALALARAMDRDGLLATSRTRPTREQIDRAVGKVLSNASNHPDPVAVLGRSIAPLRTKITDAVLELLTDHHEDSDR